MRCLVVLHSYHHKNTEKIAMVMAKVLDAAIQTPQQTDPEALQEYDLLGFGSGIYSARHHETVLELADRLPQAEGQKAFVFSTFGAPAIAVTKDYVAKNHSLLRARLQAKGYTIVDEFGCAGFNTNSFLKSFGGLNKGRPNVEDLDQARTFAAQLTQNTQTPTFS